MQKIGLILEKYISAERAIYMYTLAKGKPSKIIKMSYCKNNYMVSNKIKLLLTAVIYVHVPTRGPAISEIYVLLYSPTFLVILQHNIP